MKKREIIKHLDDAIDKQIPDVWNEIEENVNKTEGLPPTEKVFNISQTNPGRKKRKAYVRFWFVAVVCLLLITTFTFTPAFASLQKVYDKIFSSKYIDDSGLKSALFEGIGQEINQTYYDKEHDITVHFETIMTDDKETKLLVTYESKKTNLEHYSIDNFEGKTTITIQDGDTQKRLHSVGWGSRHYDSKTNKVAEAMSFDSIKKYQGQAVHLQINNLTIYDDTNTTGEVKTTWPVDFTLKKSGVSDRETVKVNQEFSFKNQSYQVKQVEFSPFETRVGLKAPDTPIMTDKDGDQGRRMSELENQWLHARKVDKEYGYIVNPHKSGVFLRSAGKKVNPIFNKGEVEGSIDEIILVFAPVKDRKDCTLEVGDSIKVPLIKVGK